MCSASTLAETNKEPIVTACSICSPEDLDEQTVVVCVHSESSEPATSSEVRNVVISSGPSAPVRLDLPTFS